MPHKITLTGKAISPLRTCRNFYTFDMEESGSAVAPKGLPTSKEITYTIFVNKKQLNKANLDSKNLKDHKLIVQGEPTLDISIDECPGEIGLICFQLSILPVKEQPEPMELQEEEKAYKEVEDAVEQVATTLTAVPKDTEDVLPITSIIIPEDFLNSTPNPIKTEIVIEYVKQYGHLDEPILINKESLVLIDGYRRYLVAKQLEMSDVPVAYGKSGL